MRAARSLLLALLLLAACDGGEPERAPPARLSEDAVGHYCGMLLSEHPGPKGQIRLKSRDEPVWFSSARDTIAFTRIPLEPRDIAAIYVSDMARAPSWEDPGPENWIPAEEAWFVIGSGRTGGMAAPEPVPFGTEAAADAFAATEGGRVVRLDQIPDGYVLGDGAEEGQGHDAHGGGS